MSNILEQHSVEIIPPTERGGKVWSLGTFWFAVNQQFLTLIIGALAIELGLNFFWAIVAIVLGNVIGYVFMAYHSAQGPILGVTQMVQSRGQFGFYGAFFLFVAAFFLQFGYFASSVVLSGDAINSYTSHISIPGGIILVTIPVVVLAVLGYRVLHAWQRWSSFVLVIVFGLITVEAVVKTVHGGGLPASTLQVSAPNLASFFAVLSLAVTYSVSSAPFVSDYSRYLPQRTSVASTFWWTFGGAAVSTIWLMILGSLIAVLYPKGDTFTAIASLSGPWMLIVMALSLLGAAATNIYSGMVALNTAITTWRKPSRPRVERLVGIAVTLAIGLIFALAGYASFLTNFSNFLSVLSFLFVPWTAVNLTDFYFVRRRKYDAKSFFTPRGIYGGWIWQTLVAYFVGLALEIPFIDQTIFVGPFVKLLGGADISWMVGLVLPIVIYLLIARRWPPKGQIKSDEPANESLLDTDVSAEKVS